MIGKTFKVLFHLKKPKNYDGGAIPIYMRVTVNAERIEIATSLKCHPEHWMKNAECSGGKSSLGKDLNNHLSALRQKVFNIRRSLIELDKEVTAKSIRYYLTGDAEKPKMILDVFRLHNERMEALIGIDFAAGTLERYKTSLEHTRSFIKWKYSKIDYPVNRIDFEFVNDYEYWLKAVQKCSHNTSLKYIGNFRKIIRYSIRMGWLKKDPFFGYIIRRKDIPVVPLNMVELQTLKNIPLPSDRLQHVRDVFVFCCYTGLSYADVCNLKPSDVAIGIDKGKWIFINRKKTEAGLRIPLLPDAVVIMDRYEKNSRCVSGDRLLPVLSNQKMNLYLGELSALCGIRKKVTMHIARHTFATTVTLNNGVPIETVSRILGHSNLKTTQHYAKLLDTKISYDMNKIVGDV
jgi:site-specific recombinase XerD